MAVDQPLFILGTIKNNINKLQYHTDETDKTDKTSFVSFDTYPLYDF